MHQPVLLDEVIKYLNPQPNQNFIDATIGDGGHALEILRHTFPDGKLLGIDWDEAAIENLKGDKKRGQEGERGKNKIVGSGLDTGSAAWESEPPRAGSRSGIEPRSYVGDLESRLVLKQGNFAHLTELMRPDFVSEVSGILFDLGLRIGEIENASRGFSFMTDGPLNMRYSRTDADYTLTAAEIVNAWSEKELARIFKELGEEKNYKRIAKAIAAARVKKEIKTTGELVEILDKTNRTYRSYKAYSRIFQALRMAVNGELENLEAGLAGAWGILDSGGKIAVISFHSLEDRLVKNFFKDKQQAGSGQILTPKPIVPTEAEIKTNSRSRSAKLRVIQKI